MIIAVNAVTPAFKPAAADFFQAIFFKIAAEQPQHQFIFIGFNTSEKNAAANCSFINLASSAKSPLRFKYWLNFKLPSLLKKNKAGILISYNCCSLRLQIPQLLFIDDVSFLNQPKHFAENWLRFFKKNMPAFLQKAAYAVTTSFFLQKEITGKCSITEDAIAVIYAAANEVFKPAIHWNQKETVKEQLTDGKEYFLYTGSINEQYNLINLLKAFSFFKQRQKSNMQLVLASAKSADAGFIKTLSSYKYRTEVVLAENISITKMASFVTAAYAVVLPAVFDDDGINAIQAIQCNTPVIAANNTALPEICGEAAVYCYPNDFNDIAAKMMLLFTNEDRRNLLIAKSREQARRFDASTAATQLWQLVKNTTNR
jgi:glycosyltransferase involved in cell wall biosynthesis